MRLRVRPYLIRAIAFATFVSLIIFVAKPSKDELAERDFELTSAERAWDHPVDPRPLLERLESGDMTFDWSDWLDLRKVALFESKELDPKLYPYLSEKPRVSDLELPYRHQATQHEHAMIGRLYCKHFLPAPSRVIALPDPLGNDTTKGYHVVHADDQRMHKQYGHKKTTAWESAPALVPDLSSSNIEQQFRPVIPSELFAWEPESIIEELGEDHPHSLTLKKSLEDVGESDKHFYEVSLRSDPLGYGVHYDWRFFRGVRDYDAHTAAIHALARTWQQFTDREGIASWYAHGPLIGWYWNGFTLPWDPDLDVQVPVRELDRLARVYNRTLVVQHSREGVRKYLLDFGPWYVERTSGNGNNVIDGRFIDVDTGAYIDITGLSYLDGSEPTMQCKAKHRYLYQSISPLRRSAYEGLPAYIPNEIKRVLRSEYRKFDQSRYGRWRFNTKIKLWVLEMTCDQMLGRFSSNSRIFCFPKDIIPEDQCNVRELGTCDRYAIADFNLTNKVTSDHSIEWELWTQDPQPLREIAEVVNTYHPPFHVEGFLDGIAPTK